MQKIKNIEVIINTAKINLQNKVKVKNLLNFLSRQKINLKLDENSNKSLNKNFNTDFKKADLILALGGDGTILRATKKALKDKLPVMGINIGGFGFLSECSPDDVQEILKKIISGNYFYKKSMLLSAQIIRQNKNIFKSYALNDVVIHVSKIARLGHFNVGVENINLCALPADGIIISTPAGSTAYSLSCGGPIVFPQHNLLILTPICAHTLFARSIIISKKEMFKISIAGKIDEAVVTLDGQEFFPFRWGDILVVKKSNKSIEFISTNKEDFYNKIKTKLRWGEQIIK